MRNHVFLVVGLFLVCIVSSCQQRTREATPGSSKADVAADVASIKASVARWVPLYNRGAFDELVSTFYADDATLMSPDKPAHAGKKAILHAYLADAAVNAEHCDSSVVEAVRVSGDLAVARGMDTGTTTPKSGGGPLRYSVKWLMAFERQPDGKWKCIDEIWNDNYRP